MFCVWVTIFCVCILCYGYGYYRKSFYLLYCWLSCLFLPLSCGLLYQFYLLSVGDMRSICSIVTLDPTPISDMSVMASLLSCISALRFSFSGEYTISHRLLHTTLVCAFFMARICVNVAVVFAAGRLPHRNRYSCCTVITPLQPQWHIAT